MPGFHFTVFFHGYIDMVGSYNRQVMLTTREHLITPLFSGVHVCVLNISELSMFKWHTSSDL